MSDADLLEDYLKTVPDIEQVPEADKARFLATARACNLNPFKREVYAIVQGAKVKKRLVIVTGYEVYIRHASASGLLKGWHAWTEGGVEYVEKVKRISSPSGDWDKRVTEVIGDLRAVIEIRRSDWDQCFRHEVYLEEYAQENEMWGQKPRTMLKKVAIAQAFRLAFPEQLAGMPYTSDELPAVQAQEPQESKPADLRGEAKRLSDRLGLTEAQRVAAFNFADRNIERVVADLRDRLAKKQAQPAQIQPAEEPAQQTGEPAKAEEAIA